MTELWTYMSSIYIWLWHWKSWGLPTSFLKEATYLGGSQSNQLNYQSKIHVYTIQKYYKNNMYLTWHSESNTSICWKLFVSAWPRAMESQKTRGSYSKLLLILGLLCTRTRIGFGLNLGDSEVRCIEEERQALLKFKQGLKDHLDLLSSWGNHEDCCKWIGIKCNKKTSHVVKLDLRAHSLIEFSEGEINSSLLGLQHLTYLDLRNNDFNGQPSWNSLVHSLNYNISIFPAPI